MTLSHTKKAHIDIVWQSFSVLSRQSLIFLLVISILDVSASKPPSAESVGSLVFICPPCVDASSPAVCLRLSCSLSEQLHPIKQVFQGRIGGLWSGNDYRPVQLTASALRHLECFHSPFQLLTSLRLSDRPCAFRLLSKFVRPRRTFHVAQIR